MAYKLIFNRHDQEYKVLNNNGHVVWNGTDLEATLKGASEFLNENIYEVDL